MAPDISQIKPGSILGYFTPDDAVDWIITRTGPLAHIEIYEGNGMSLASRNGVGVSRYPFRAEGLTAVLTSPKLDIEKFSAWFETVMGDAYDWAGLAGFVKGEVTQEIKHWFCSAVIAKGCQMAGTPMFNPLWSPSLITPSDFLKTAELSWEWVDVARIYMFST